VVITLNGWSVPVLDGAYDLIDMGCIPGAAFNNMKYVGDQAVVADTCDYNTKMLMFDAQTSGGLLISCDRNRAETVMAQLQESGYPHAAIVGEVKKRTDVREPFLRLS
jgi:selenide,water dikinase